MEKIHTLDDSLKLFFTQLSKIKTYESTLRSNTDKILYDLYTKKKNQLIPLINYQILMILLKITME